MARNDDRANILLIQNSNNTLRVVQRALEANNTRCRLHMVGIGRSTLSYLRQDGPYAEAPTPDLILCDLIEPTLDAVSIIKALKADRHCRSIPMVFLTSDQSHDALESINVDHDDDASFSPVDLDHFLKALNAFKLERFTHAVSLLEKFGSILVRIPEPTGIEKISQSRGLLEAAM